MTTALYATIWTSLLLFAVGETGRHVTTRAWPRVVFAAGLLFCLVHIAIAMGHVHGWSHAAAMAATAAQTDAVFGLDWGGGMFVNYAFALAWGADAALWRAGTKAGPATRTLRWLLRIFYAIVLINAAVIFAAGVRRLLGLAIVIWLFWIWSRGIRRT